MALRLGKHSSNLFARKGECEEETGEWEEFLHLLTRILFGLTNGGM